MRRLMLLIGMSVFGGVGWWLAEPLGIFAAFMISLVASGVGLYGARKFNDYYLP